MEGRVDLERLGSVVAVETRFPPYVVVDGDGRAEVDVLAVGRAEVGQHVVIDAATLAAHLLDREAVILCGPGNHSVRGQGETPGLLGLPVEVPRPDHALVRVEQIAAQRVQRLALVQLARDLAPIALGNGQFELNPPPADTDAPVQETVSV